MRKKELRLEREIKSVLDYDYEEGLFIEAVWWR